ncbi:MAG TPA: polyprenyl diphosphate synthase [Rhabdochlamydiaceae bacterium]|nr:polyprenyl diphosphate synthase [Rhabdochlamydiaceae bacterium]
MKTESIIEEVTLDADRIPKHIAIIMDGNRRWAKKRGLPAVVGHWHGAEALSKLVEDAATLGVRTLTVYAFSTENWNRASKEIDSLMNLFQMYLKGQKQRMVAEGVRLGIIGDLSRLPQEVRATLDDAREATAHCNRINLVIAVNYGARDNIRRAVAAIAQDCANGKIQKEEITENLIGSYLDTAPWGDPALLIRTGGENRLSNFLLLEISYAEGYITDILWPDFNQQELVRAIAVFQKRERRKGC